MPHLGEADRALADAFLKVALVAGGNEVQPAQPIKVEVETNVLKAAQPAGIEAALLGNPDVTVVERQNLTGKRDDGSEDPNPSAVRVALTTHRLGDFGLSVVASKRFERDLDGAHVTVYAPRPQGIDIQEDVRESEAKDGMDLRRVLRFTTDPATAWASTLWIEATEDAAAPGHDLGGLVCRVMEGEDLKDEVFGKKGTDGLAEIASNKAYALLWDSGYRDQTVEAAGVTFEGSMPEGPGPRRAMSLATIATLAK